MTRNCSPGLSSTGSSDGWSWRAFSGCSGYVERAGGLDWEPGAGAVYLRRLDNGQVWRVDITMTARTATPEEASSRWG